MTRWIALYVAGFCVAVWLCALFILGSVHLLEWVFPNG